MNSNHNLMLPKIYIFFPRDIRPRKLYLFSKYGKFPEKLIHPTRCVDSWFSFSNHPWADACLALIIISIAIGVDPFHSLRSKVDTAAAALHEEEEEVDDDDFNEVGRVKKIKHIFRSIK